MFITFEGIDGCGKSTQAKLLYKRLIDKKIKTILTREPGGTPISEKIRELILDPNNKEMVPSCELLLYLAARAQHVTEVIRPELKKGNVVISDRFEEATYVYQGYGRNLLLGEIKIINKFATKNITPDLTFILDISVEEAQKRIQASGKIKDRMEKNSIEFFNRIRKGYLIQYETNSSHLFKINGSLPEKVISEIIYKHIQDHPKYHRESL